MKSNNIAFILTLFLIALIILTAPTTSLDVLLNGLSGTFTKGSSILFSIQANIHSSEQIPIDFVLLKITGQYNFNCKIYMNNTVENCPFLSISSIEYDYYSYGYGYGYESGYLGYGYGYGPTKIKINLNIDTSSFEGDYNAIAEIHAGITPNTYTFTSSSYSFSIRASKPGSSSSGEIKYFIDVLEIKGGNGSYSVKVRNSGKEKLNIYLVIQTPEGNKTYQPVELESGKEALLNYTIKQGSYNYTIIVIGETNEVKIAKEIGMVSDIEKQIIQQPANIYPKERQEERQEAEKETKSPLTGLATAITETASKYKIALVAIAIIGILIFVKIKY